jgi:hypothetical protein
MRFTPILLFLAATAVLNPAHAGAAPDDAVAEASYGQAEVWLRTGDDGRELVFRPAPGAAEQVLAVTVPPRETGVLAPSLRDGLALGLDAAGKLTVVMQSRDGLQWTRIAGQPQLRRVRGTDKRDILPSLFRGRLAYTDVAGPRSSVRLGSLTSAKVKTLWRSTSDNEAARATAIGANDTVAFVTVADGAAEGLYDAYLVRGARPLDIWRGDKHNGGLSLAVSTDGRQLTVKSRHDDVRYTLPTGRRLR